MVRRPTKYVILAAVVLALLSTVTGVQAEQYVNSSEPAFLQDIGPQDVRADNPVIAAVTLLIVIGVILRGLRKYGPTSDNA